MVKVMRRPPQLFEVVIAPEAQHEFELLPPRIASAVHRFLLTAMREDPEKHGVRMRGAGKGRWLVQRPDFQIVYTVDHAARRVSILRIESR